MGQKTSENLMNSSKKKNLPIQEDLQIGQLDYLKLCFEKLLFWPKNGVFFNSKTDEGSGRVFESPYGLSCTPKGCSIKTSVFLAKRAFFKSKVWG